MTRRLAFSGAEGFGAHARGGRGGDRYAVTSLADRGPGSLREGIETAAGPRVIDFSVGGTIQLSSRLIIDKPYLTITGETAPGRGITLRDFETTVMNTHDVVIRYVRFRLGDAVGAEHDALQIFESRNVIIDHVSASWSIDEVLSTQDSTYVTVQWSIISEGLHDSAHSKGLHSMGTLCQGGRVSLHHNLYAHNNQRNPLVRQRCDVVNNVIYNWGSVGADVGLNPPAPDPRGPTKANLENNYFVKGPSSPAENDRFFRGRKNAEVWESGGNILDAGLDGAPSGVIATVFLGDFIAADRRFRYPRITTDSARTAYDRVLAGAGSSEARDAVDERIVEDVRNGSGSIINSQDDVGGWP